MSAICHRVEQQLDEIAAWFTWNIIADEISCAEPLPSCLRHRIARCMVEDERMGWPDIATANGELDFWQWTSPDPQETG